MNNNSKQRGEVSLIVVIFATLLITIVVVSYVRMMIQIQQQATATDLSQSAFDSAQVGVEDAKRALLKWQAVCSGDPASADECTELTDIIKSSSLSQECNSAVNKLTDLSDALGSGEIKVQNGSIGNDLNQAYTCVTINTQTDDYLGVLEQDASKLIPLVGASNFDRIKIEWFSSKDLEGSNPNVDFSILGTPLLSTSNWPVNRPSIMRAQLIQFNKADGFKLSDFDENLSANATNNTHFLYPSASSGTSSFTSDGRKISKYEPTNAKCVNDALVEYKCFTILVLPKNGDGHTQYLNLTSLYKSAHFRVKLFYDTTEVKFDGVQPSIDSTGRANDLFRRVETRVQFINADFPYPQAAVDLTGNLCKDFTVTNDISGYSSSESCDPSAD